MNKNLQILFLLNVCLTNIAFTQTPPPNPTSNTTIALKNSPNCMNCKHLDTIAGFMYAYSYCPAKDLCQPDVWNYLTIMCDGGWLPGM